MVDHHLVLLPKKNSLQIYNQLMKLPNYQELILIMDHVTYVLLSQIIMNTFTHCQQFLVGRKRTQQFFKTVSISNKVRHLHHLHDPHVAGVYGPLNDKVIQDITLPAINKAFLHDPTHPLLASSKNRIDLIYIPMIYSAWNSWKQCLSEKKVMVISDLKIACNYLNSLLDFQLSEQFTIRTAIDALL